MIRKWLKEFYRISFDSILLVLLFATLIFLPQPESLDFILLRRKAMQVSAGFLSGHIIGKAAFPKIDWNKEGQDKLKTLRIVIYALCIYAWAEGG